MTYNLYHKTEFSYQGMVTFSHNIARLKPKNTPSQQLIDFTMEVTPVPYETHEYTDMFGNVNTHLLIREAHQNLSLIGKSTVTLIPSYHEERYDYARQNCLTCNEVRQRLLGFHTQDVLAKQFLFESELIPLGSQAIRAYALESFHPNRSLFEACYEFMNRIFADFTFVSGFSDITTPIDEIFEAKKGVCQDFAQFAISALRSLGLPAKYMSGYIETIPAKGKKKLFGADASHAWFALYIPQIGWIEFDPTNNILPTHQHILLGEGRDYNDIAPLKGVVMSSGESTLSVMVDVRQTS